MSIFGGTDAKLLRILDFPGEIIREYIHSYRISRFSQTEIDLGKSKNPFFLDSWMLGGGDFKALSALNAHPTHRKKDDTPRVTESQAQADTQIFTETHSRKIAREKLQRVRASLIYVEEGWMSEDERAWEVPKAE